MMDGQRQMTNRKKKNVKTFVSSERKNQTPVTTRAPLKEKNITLDALNGNNLRRGLQKDVGSKSPDSENQLVGRRNKLKLGKKETGFGNVKKDQIVSGSAESKTRFDNDGPNANGTFSSPWRFNCEYITRNPHFVVVKPNALPSVNQKAILDHTFVEEVEKDCEYIKPSSPKRSTSSKSPTKTPKRKVLGNIDLNHMDVIKCGEFSPPRRSIFGFNSTSEERGSPVIIRGDAKPFRLYLPTEKEKPRPILEEETVSSKSGQNQEAKHEICLELRDSQREVNEEATIIGLFEDIEEKKPLRCYIKKRRKKRLRSVDYDDNELENTRKKHKEKENPELEKWAKEFNSMCEEIDKDELEIE